VKRRRIVAPPSSQPRKWAWPRGALSIEASAKLEALRGFTPSSDYFDEIRQFLAGIEVYPFIGRVQIGQTPVSFALNPYQNHVRLNLTSDLAVFRE
jgi:hypothetical protein